MGQRTLGRFVLALGAVVLLGVVPLALVLSKALAAPGVLLETLQAEEAWRALGSTLILAIGTTAFALIVGAPLAWLTTRTDLPCKGFLRSILTIPYIIPPYIGAIAWITLANPEVGLLTEALRDVLEGIRGLATAVGLPAGLVPAVDIYSMGGLIWVMGLSFYSYVFLTVRAALESADPSLEDAARMSGAGTWRVIKDVSLPLMRPAMLSSAGLVFMATASAFGAPVLIGNAAGIDFLSTSIFEAVTGGLHGMAEASSLACLLFAFALVPLLLRSKHHAVLTGKAVQPSVVRLGAAKGPALLLVLGFVGVGVLLPAFAVVATAFMRFPGDLSASNFTFENFAVLSRAGNSRAIVTSLLLAGGAATLAVMLGGLIAWLQVKTRRRGRHLLAGVAALPLATPGTVLALGLILVWTTPLKLVNTIWIFLIAYLAKYVALAGRAIGEGLGTVDDALPDAARVSGAKGFFLLRTIWVPLVLPSIVAGWFLVFMPSFSELTMSVLLMGPDVETIGIQMYRMCEYSSPTSASVLATIVLALVVGSNLLLRIFSRGKYGV